MATTFEIFPAIGIARVGSSQLHFIGPEPDVPLNLRRRDAARNLLRQAARFRVYQCDRDAQGNLLNATEVTAAVGHVEWTVHLVNRKAAAQSFFGNVRRNTRVSRGSVAPAEDTMCAAVWCTRVAGVAPTLYHFSMN